MTDYKILISTSKEQLQIEVNHYLEMGYELYGNLEVTFYKLATNERGWVQYTQVVIGYKRK